MRQSYGDIYAQLSEMSDRIEDMKREHADLLKDTKAQIDSISHAAIESTEDFEAKRKTLTAFMGIAEQYATKKSKATEPQEFDRSVLDALALDIDSAARTNPAADELYEKASAMLLYLEQSDESSAIQEKRIAEIKNNFAQARSDIKKRTSNVWSQAVDYMQSPQFIDFFSEIEDNRAEFINESPVIDLNVKKKTAITIGSIGMPFDFSSEMTKYIQQAARDAYDDDTKLIQWPLDMKMDHGQLLLVEYDDDNEHKAMSGMQNFILNALHFNQGQFSKVLVIDPLRYSSTCIDRLESLTQGAGHLIERVPPNQSAATDAIKNVISHCRETRAKSKEKIPVPDQIMVLYGYKSRYNQDAVNLINQIALEAHLYGIIIVLLFRKSAQENELLKVMSKRGALISTEEDGSFAIHAKGTAHPFTWYPILSPRIEPFSSGQEEEHGTGNNYIERIGYAKPEYVRGHRRIENIPIGVDDDGRLVKASFEDTNFATFICGASRSGKSTLLHTLITGIISSMHPDDVELWLVDFKMTEFSSYIDHMPPHIKYIVLDESPDLVFDIVDKLGEILTYRMDRFKSKRWDKLSSVPATQHMPAIFVLIDEFSIMSQIIADSASEGDNYKPKVAALLKRGAAFGIRFLFASQSFTSGCSGLSDDSKQQVQQRIAMKAQVNEIKETLALKNPSDLDNKYMERLEPHYALLLKEPPDDNCHLVKSHVLFAPDDYESQHRFIDDIASTMTKRDSYCFDDINAYVDKHPLVIDGNRYLGYGERQAAIDTAINAADDTEEFRHLYIGEPRTLSMLHDIPVSDAFGENFLIFGQANEAQCIASIILSIKKSLDKQESKSVIWTQNRDPLARALGTSHGIPTISGVEAVCSEIKGIRKKIDKKEYGNKYIFVMGLKAMFDDMQYSDFSQSSGITMKGGEKGAMDLSTLLAKNIASGKTYNEDEYGYKEDMQTGGYDAREDFKMLIQRGAGFGYHFILCFNTVTEFIYTKLILQGFKHKILFCLPKNETTQLAIGAQESKLISEMSKHTFRYTSGTDSQSYRPFLHESTSWDGWEMDENGYGINRMAELD